MLEILVGIVFLLICYIIDNFKLILFGGIAVHLLAWVFEKMDNNRKK